MPTALGRLRRSSRNGARAGLELFRSYAAEACPPPLEPAHRVVYGLAQPVLSLRLMLRDRKLLRAALEPALMLALVCAVSALFGAKSNGGYLVRFYHMFAVLAPVPPVLFARHYARLAARARTELGFGPCEPRYKSIVRSLWQACAQVVLVALVIAAVSELLSILPAVGKALAAAATALWALHWIVVEALDGARVLGIGERLEAAEARAAAVTAPWFVRGFRRAAAHLPRVIGGPIRAFARLCDRLSRPWREEIALIERHPWIALGFSLSTALLLAIPGLNLIFRPTIVIASAHLLGHLEADEARKGPPERLEAGEAPDGLNGGADDVAMEAIDI